MPRTAPKRKPPDPVPTTARPFGHGGVPVSAVGFGAWAIGGSWGKVDDAASSAALEHALEKGVTFFDTADVYGDGRSEGLVGRVCAGKPGVFIATKAGRRLPKQTVEGYSSKNLSDWIDRSRRKLGMETLDLVQLHCPPTALYKSARVFTILDDFVSQGRLRAYGVSVEKIEEAMLALDQDGVQSIQIIFNLFRQRPAEQLFDLAKKRGVSIIARVPLASGLLTGKITGESRFAADDHRNFNIRGQAFDVGETFSGVPLEAGLAAVEELRALVPKGRTMAQFALRWILMHDAVTTVIPGCKTVAQVDDNLASAELPPLSPSTMNRAREIYDRHIRVHVHKRW
ncbi:MAG TPA: aldo/keto reductase [Planctomycetota bacterium]|nr:aldo/keto reductase [Planctomycetota bacterium]